MNISLILAFRERPEHIDNMINSLRRTTRDLDNIEVILAMDDDDQAGIEHVSRLAAQGGPQIITYITKRSIHFTKDYMNPIARMARGRWIININDDTVFATEGWDQLINEAMSAAARTAGDDFFLGLPNDGMDRRGDDAKYPRFSCWPVVSRQSVQALGYLFDERFYIWSVDHYIADVYRRINRTVFLTHVLIDHNSLHTGKRKKNKLDTNHQRFCEIQDKHNFRYTEEMAAAEARKIEEHIKIAHTRAQ